MAESWEAIFVGTILEEKVACIFMYLLIFRGEGYVSLKIEEGFIGVPLDLQAFCSLEVGFRVFLLEVGGNCEILDGLAEVAEDSEDQSSKIEIFWDIILTFFDCLINISNRFIEIILIEVEYRPKVVKGRNMIIR